MKPTKSTPVHRPKPEPTVTSDFQELCRIIADEASREGLPVEKLGKGEAPSSTSQTKIPQGADVPTVERTVLQMLQCWPSLFKTRMECLHHLFVVNGNGYEWKKGALVNKFPHEQRAALPLELAEIRARDNEFTRKPYPPCEYAKLLTMPENVRQDWREAADEVRSMLASKGVPILDLFPEPPPEVVKRVNRECDDAVFVPPVPLPEILAKADLSVWPQEVEQQVPSLAQNVLSRLSSKIQSSPSVIPRGTSIDKPKKK